MIRKDYFVPENMKTIVESHSSGLGGVGVIGGVIGPGTDLAIIGGSWVTMTIQLADEAGHVFDQQTAKKVCIAVATGAGAFMVGTKIAATAFGWLGAVFTGGLSIAAAAAGNAALNYSFTKAYGYSCSRYFLQTEKIHNSEVLVSILICMMGAELGIDMGSNENVA